MRESALRFCELVAAESLELPPWLDLESRCGKAHGADNGCHSHAKASPQAVVDSSIEWMEVVTLQLRKPLLYWGRGFALELIHDGADLSGLAAYNQVLADYTGPLELIPGMPDPVIWQYSGRGIDRSHCSLSACELAALDLLPQPGLR